MQVRRLKALIVWVLVLCAAPVLAQPAPGARAVVEDFHGALIAAMKTGKAGGFAGRQKLLDPAVRRTFDLPLMTRYVVGPAWQAMPVKDQAAIAAAFSSWAVASYAGRFNAYDGEQFVTGDVSDGGLGTLRVKSQIRPKGERPTVLTYRIKSDGKSWKIVDVYLDGSVSQLASWRSEFAAVLGKQGPAGLVTRLNQLTADFAKKN